MQRESFHWIGWFLVLTISLQAQVMVPTTEEVYGGRIQWIGVYAVDATTTRILVSTESANSMFFAEVEHGTPPIFGTFTSVPDFNGDDNFGKDVKFFVVDEATGYFFTNPLSQFYGASHLAGSRTQYRGHGVTGIAAYQGTIIYTVSEHPDSLVLHLATVDATSGNMVAKPNSPIPFYAPGVGQAMELQIAVHPLNEKIYIYDGTALYKTSKSVDSLTAGATLEPLTLPSLSGILFTTFGIAPDGRLFLGAEKGTPPNHYKFIAMTDDDGAAWDTLNTRMVGTAGANFAFNGDSANYYVYFGSAFSTNKGAAGSWHAIGQNGMETHPNDGCVMVDPLDGSIVYITSDLGLAVSLDSGYTTFEINEGIEAVKVWDIEMDNTNTTGWVASKSGIRKVTHYGSAAESWELFYPMGDGAPYTAVAIDPNHPDTVYAGNMRLYRSFDGGANWERVIQIDDPSRGFDWQSHVAAVEVNPETPQFVMLGVNSPASGVRGGIFVSTDYGTTWQAIDTDVYNTEVRDIAVYPVTGDSAIYYIGCEYVSDGTTSSYGVKTVVYSPASGNFEYHNDMLSASGTLITNFGALGVVVDTSGMVFACGVNSANEPRVYYKEPDSTYWVMLSHNGLPPVGRATAITIGESSSGTPALFVAVENQVYYLEKDSVNWKIAVEYPVGTEINVLYWDELMVGMSTGLKSYQWQSVTAIAEQPTPKISRFELMGNYPNPFNPATIIYFRLGESAHVTLTVFDAAGRKITTLVNAWYSAGNYRYQWRASVPSGVYFYQMKVHDAHGQLLMTGTRKMVLIK